MASSSKGRHALILADGAAPSRALLDSAWPDWDAGASIVVAADGGARHAAPLGLRVDRWVGDGDSIDPAALAALEAAGVAIERVEAEKDESDAELAVLSALETGPGLLTIIGGLGGVRLDHALANVGLLAHPALHGLPVWLYDERGARVSLLSAPGPDGGAVLRELPGSVGDLVSLVPIGETARGVTTTGLRYPLSSEALVLGRSRGISNVRTEEVARISLESGRVLLIETPANLAP